MTIELPDSDELDAILEVLRKHRVAQFEGGGVKLVLRDDPQPGIAEQLSKMPKQNVEDEEAILFHSAPSLPDLPKPPPGVAPYGSEK